MAISLIHDGDHGGDDFITTLLFLAYPEYFDLKAITTVTGNAGVEHTTRNALKALHLARRTDIPVYSGAAQPLKVTYRLGDDAFGSDGLGHITMPGEGTAQSENAISWLSSYLPHSLEPLTLCVTGPATNIATLLEQDSTVRHKIKRIIMMGGGVNIGGNIKPYAEFNFYMDPDAAQVVLNSGIPVVLHTLDTTHQAVYTKARQTIIRDLQPTDLSEKIDAIIRITEELEKKSFGAEGSFFHDHQVAAYLAMPDNYKTRPVRAQVQCGLQESEPGRLIVSDDTNGTVHLVTEMIDAELFFSFVVSGIEKILAQHKD